MLVNTNVFGNASFSNVVGTEFGTEFKEIILVGNTETEKLRLSGDQFSSGWYLCVPPLLSEVSLTLLLKQFQCMSD